MEYEDGSNTLIEEGCILKPGSQCVNAADARIEPTSIPTYKGAFVSQIAHIFIVSYCELTFRANLLKYLCTSKIVLTIE